MITFFNQPGFLGTHASLRPDLTLILILISAILFSIGWRLAVQKRFAAHQVIQTLAVILNSLVVLLSMVGVFIKYYLPGISGNINSLSVALPFIHAVTGALGMIYGIYIVLSANEILPKRWQFTNFKLFMRISYVLYMLLTVGGAFLYYTLYR